MLDNKRKVLEVRPNGLGMFHIRFQGGGEVPASLSGVYNNASKAQVAVDVYLANRDGVKVSGKNKVK